MSMLQCSFVNISHYDAHDMIEREAGMVGDIEHWVNAWKYTVQIDTCGMWVCLVRKFSRYSLLPFRCCARQCSNALLSCHCTLRNHKILSECTRQRERSTVRLIFTSVNFSASIHPYERNGYERLQIVQEESAMPPVINSSGALCCRLALQQCSLSL